MPAARAAAGPGRPGCVALRRFGHPGAMPADVPARCRRQPRSARPYRVCLVCLGNICRSPMAEVVLRAELDRAGPGRRGRGGERGHRGLAPGRADGPGGPGRAGPARLRRVRAPGPADRAVLAGPVRPGAGDGPVSNLADLRAMATGRRSAAGPDPAAALVRPGPAAGRRTCTTRATARCPTRTAARRRTTRRPSTWSRAGRAAAWPAQLAAAARRAPAQPDGLAARCRAAGGPSRRRAGWPGGSRTRPAAGADHRRRGARIRAAGAQHRWPHYRVTLADGRAGVRQGRPPPDLGGVLRGRGRAGCAGWPTPARCRCPRFSAGTRRRWSCPGCRSRPPDQDAAEQFGRDLAGCTRPARTRFGAPWPGFIASLPLPERPGRGDRPGRAAGQPCVRARAAGTRASGCCRTCAGPRTPGALGPDRRPAGRGGGQPDRQPGRAAPSRPAGSTATAGPATCCGPAAGAG